MTVEANSFTILPGIDEEKVSEMEEYRSVLKHLAGSAPDSPRFLAVTDYAEKLRAESELALLELQTNHTDTQSNYTAVGAKAGLDAQIAGINNRIEVNKAIPGYTKEYDDFEEMFDRKLREQEESRIPSQPKQDGVIFAMHDALRKQLARNNVGQKIGIMVAKLQRGMSTPAPQAA